MKLNPINLNKNYAVYHTSEDKKNTTVNTGVNVFASTNPLTIESAESIKSQLNIKTPIAYSFLGDYDIPNAGIAKFYKLANGQKIVILPKKGPTVLKSYFNVGSMNEPDNIRGVSHFDEHMAFNGTENLGAGEFFKITNDMGAMTNASTGFSMTDYYISSQLLNPNDLEESIRIQSEMLQKPKYAPEMIEKEKGPVTSEISMVGDAPENTALNNCIKNLYQIKTTSDDLVAGNVKNIMNITRDDAYNYYKTWYTPDNCVTVVTGEVDPQKTIDLISKYFNSANNLKPENRKYEDLKPINASIRKDVKMPQALGTTAALGLSGPQNSNAKEYIELEILLMTLLGYKGARISKALDKLQTSAIFNVERTGNRPEDPRTILIVGQSTPEKSEKLIKTIYDEINKLHSNPITEEELNTAKNMLKLGYSNLCENSHLLNHFIGTALIDNDLNYTKNYLNMIEKISVQDISSFADKYFDLNKASLSVVHPSSLDNASILNNYKNVNQKKSIAFKGRYDNKTLDLSKIKQYRLNNNMELVFNPNNSDLLNYEINLDTKVPVLAKPAVPMLFSVMLNEGSASKNYNQLYTESNKKGIEIKFKSDFNSITAHVNALHDYNKDSLAIVKEVLTSPRLNEASLKYAKDFIRESVKNTSNIAAEMLLKELFPSTPEFCTKEELLQSIDSVTLKDIGDFYLQIMNKAQATGVFTAPLNKDKNIVKDTIESLSKGLRNFEPNKVVHFETYTPVKEPKILTKADPGNQADIVEAFKFKTNYNPKDHITFSLLDTILGDGPYSRLFNDLREKQKLAYRVNSNVEYHGNTGILSMEIMTTTDDKNQGVISYDNVNKSLDGFKKHIQELKTRKVSESELASAKQRLTTKILNSLATSNEQTNILARSKNTPYSLAAVKETLTLAEQITADDIYNAANYIFNSNPVISILASQETLDNIKLPPASDYKC